MPNLVLYYFEDCPYCDLVMDFMASQNIVIPIKDIRKDPKAKKELLRVGGRTQVPCLGIDGKALYESADIIQWFKDNVKKS